MEGFIPIKRSLFGHFLFKERRTFSRFEAWLDLIQMASFTDENTELIGGKLIARDRGEVVASLRYLGGRWNWSMHKVTDFLELLRSQDMVVATKENGVTKIRLVNFEKHNTVGGSNTGRNAKGNRKNRDTDGVVGKQGTAIDTQTASVREQRGNSEGTNINKDNKGNKGKGGADAPTPPGDYSDEQKGIFNAFSAWIDKYAPKVNQLKEPLTIEQFLKLRDDFPGETGKQLIREVLQAMHNKKTLLKEYESANLTLRSWINLRKRKAGEVTGPDAKNNINERLKAAGKNSPTEDGNVENR